MVSSEKKKTSGLDRACVLLPPLQREWRCQNGIPVAWRHDIIYLFCTIHPPSSHYLCFLETGERVHGSGQRNRMFLWGEQQALQRAENGSSRCFVPAGGALLRNSWL